MSYTLSILAAWLLVPLDAPLVAHSADINIAKTLDRQWVAADSNGKLEYKTTPKGDRIMDFSHAGYMGGGVALPVLPVKKEVRPSGGDDSAAIQAAVDEVSALPLANGFRGAVLLEPGTFRCSKPIIISQDGVAVRGSWGVKSRTLIEMTGEPHTAFIIEGPDLSFPKETPANSYPIADGYVPAGTLRMSVKDAMGLAAGDVISIRWARTAKWIQFMGMDDLVRKRKGKPDSPQTWMKEGSTQTIHRSIRSIDGNCITLDVPLTDAIDAQLLDEPAVIIKTPSLIDRREKTPLAPLGRGAGAEGQLQSERVPRSPSPLTPLPIGARGTDSSSEFLNQRTNQRLSQCGIESLQIVSPPHNGTLKAGKNISVALKGDLEDCWVRDLVMRETLNNVQVWGGRRITITGAHSYHESTVEKGAGYPADISIRGSQVLVDRCSSHGLGGFYVATLNPGATLNVVLNCTFEGTGSIQPQMHWSTGLLIDSCHIPDGRIDLINRHSSGTGHGWAIGWGIAWNCDVKHLQVQMPPGALNLAIGCKDEPHKTYSQESFFSANEPVTPASLYLAQLRKRLGDAAVKNIGY